MKDKMFGIVILAAVMAAIIFYTNAPRSQVNKDIFDEYVEYSEAIRSKLLKGESVDYIHFETLQNFEALFEKQSEFVKRNNNEIESLKHKNIAQN